MGEKREGNAIVFTQGDQLAGGAGREAEGDSTLRQVAKILVGDGAAAADLQQLGGVTRFGGQGGMPHEEVGEGGDHTVTSPSQKEISQM